MLVEMSGRKLKGVEVEYFIIFSIIFNIFQLFNISTLDTIDKFIH